MLSKKFGYKIDELPVKWIHRNESKLNILIDSSLSRFKDIFAAAGHPNCVFKISYSQLLTITNGSEKEISE